MQEIHYTHCTRKVADNLIIFTANFIVRFSSCFENSLFSIPNIICAKSALFTLDHFSSLQTLGILDLCPKKLRNNNGVVGL